MRISRIYSDQPLSPHSNLTLEEKSSHYLSRVLRLKVGASVILFNGDGDQYPADIVEVGKKTVTVQTGEVEHKDCESPLNIHLGIAISRGERMDWIMQKATELGVTAITPLLSERIEVKLKGERGEKKLQHWRQIAISACEQCGRNRLPIVDTTQPLEQWLTKIEADKKFVLHHRTDQQLNAQDQVESVALLIGPEGGLSATEIAQAEQSGFSALRLGQRVLRTETAPLAAIAVLQHVWGDF